MNGGELFASLEGSQAHSGDTGVLRSPAPLRAIWKERGRDRHSLSLELTLLVSSREGVEVLVREPTSYGGSTGLEVLPRKVQPLRSPEQKGHPHTLTPKVKAPTWILERHAGSPA
jgi:hypothetical protein